MILQPPITPDGPTARGWLRAELLKPEYQPPLLDRIRDRLLDLLDRLTSHGGSLQPVLLYALLLALLALLVVAATRIRGRVRRPRGDAEVFAAGRRPAREHRRLAEAAYASGDWRTAVVEGMRALTADLIEREVVPDAPALTVGEVVARAAPRYGSTGLGDALADAGRVFDETLYGDREATAARARTMLDLDERIRSIDPDRRGDAPVLAVPR